MDGVMRYMFKARATIQMQEVQVTGSVDKKEARTSLIHTPGTWPNPHQQISSAHAIAQAFTELIRANVLFHGQVSE